MKRFAANAEETVDVDKSGNERVVKLAAVLIVVLVVGISLSVKLPSKAVVVVLLPTVTVTPSTAAVALGKKRFLILARIDLSLVTNDAVNVSTVPSRSHVEVAAVPPDPPQENANIDKTKITTIFLISFIMSP